ncbi:tetratricopeptide repeat protein, partial [bacterium]|nr:tetratricopeptide repeat protein [bacterium]
MLAHVAQTYDPHFKVDSIWDTLQNLLVVKDRELPTFMVDENDPDTTLLFLHDEMYFWFDRHERAQSEVVVTKAIIAWYEQQINALEKERGDLTLALLEHEPTPDPSTNALPEPSDKYREIRERLATITRRQEQYRLDLLHYRYQTSAGSEKDVADLVPATHAYNLLAYEAILGRDIGLGATLRQETLQNSYRLLRKATLPPCIQAECAARWLLRIAYNDVQATAANPEETIQNARKFTEQLGAKPEDQLARVLMDVAEANFRIEKVGLADEDKHERVEELLTNAEQLLQTAISKDAHFQLWTTFLRAEMYQSRGYAARRQYNLPEAIRNYREAYTVAREQERLKKLQAEILNNLAFALSEQGLVDEARELAQTALRIRLQSASDYDIALSRNTLARIEIRAGQPALAYQFAQTASATMQRINSTRGQFMTRPVLAETQRKLAEQLSYAPAQQHRLFEQAINELKQLATDMEGKSRSAERWREVYQNLGCTYRSKALSRQDRRVLFKGENYKPENDDDLTEAYRSAVIYLKQAYRVASGQAWSHQDTAPDAEQQHAFTFDDMLAPHNGHTERPDVFLVDILEDLAVIFVNADVYDPRLFQLLDAAERQAPPEYRITDGGRIRELKDDEATRGYWRELGQVELQRMLAMFGIYEYGFFEAPTPNEDGQIILYGGNEANRKEEPNNLQRLDEAVEHMIRMLAYLLHYDPEALLLKKARQLTLRELTTQNKRLTTQNKRVDIVSQLSHLRQKADTLLRRKFDLGTQVQAEVEKL